MYHRFNENKYPSTNIQVKDFKEQLQIIKDNKINFINPKQFGLSLKSEKKKKKVLLTIDDAFLSFYQNAWPILKKEKIPFILFVSTREVGSFNYMNWDQIREIADEDFVHIGNHSHSHEYLVDYDSADIINDIKKSISILKEEIGYNSEFFSYPFGEYSFEFKKIVEDLNFKYAFGQHSGVADETKDLLELPRFPINEKYGKVERFKKLLFTLPFKYKAIFPIDKYIDNSNNPPKVIIDFIDNIKDLKKMNCYSNEENEWRKSKITFVTDSQVEIKLMGKFTTERGRINCSLQDFGKYWRWLGIQFVILEN
jgi:peptidoglycan/xylan/chitin deacetylase (PgdA/CDA1 family)